MTTLTTTLADRIEAKATATPMHAPGPVAETWQSIINDARKLEREISAYRGMVIVGFEGGQRAGISAGEPGDPTGSRDRSAPTIRDDDFPTRADMIALLARCKRAEADVVMLNQTVTGLIARCEQAEAILTATRDNDLRAIGTLRKALREVLERVDGPGNSGKSATIIRAALADTGKDGD